MSSSSPPPPPPPLPSLSPAEAPENYLAKLFPPSLPPDMNDTSAGPSPAPKISPPYPPTLPPASSVPRPVTSPPPPMTPVISPAPSQIRNPILSPPSLASQLPPPVAAPPPDATVIITPVYPPLSPEPPNPIPPVTPPSLPPLRTSSPPPSTAPPPAPSTIIQPPPTRPSYPPPFTSKPPTSRTLTLQPVSSRQFHASTGVIIGCVIGGVFLLLLLLGCSCNCYKDRKRRMRRNPITALPADKLPILASKDDSKNVVAQHSSKNGNPLPGACVITAQTKTFPLPAPPSATSTSSTNSKFENPVPPQALPHIVVSSSSGTFTYDELVVATNGFSDVNLIGQGGFGYVHRGFLPNGNEVAVKQLKEGSRQGDREFQAEVDIISRVHHKHLVSFVGYCINGSARLLVYEFVPNKTLEFHLHGSEQLVMKWGTRMQIAIGSAKGLAYLHEDCNPTIIHRDIKAVNILLDHNFEAKVSDFGLAKSFPDATRDSITHISTRVVGTFGYLAPEYASSGKVTEKSDVYSFGVVLLELITGRQPIIATESEINEGLVSWARPLLMQALQRGNFEALVDPRLINNYDTSQMANMVACAAACVRHSAWLRPRMSQILRALEGEMHADALIEGMNRPDSTLYGPSRSPNWVTYQYSSSWLRGISGTGTTSEYGLNPSSSSGDSSSSSSIE